MTTAIKIINDLYFRRFFTPIDPSITCKGFDVAAMFGNKRNDMVTEQAFATYPRKRRVEFFYGSWSDK
jgi:hypothetical protein